MSTLRQRNPVGGSNNPAASTYGAAGAGLRLPARTLKRIDIFRKTPADLTEGTLLGGLVTTVSVVVLFLLFILETRAMLAVEYLTDIVVDRGEEETFRINLNVTFPGMACEYLAVDLRNAIGSDREDVDDETLHKFAMDETKSWKGSATKKVEEVVHAYDKAPPVDHYGNKRYAIELTPTTFQEGLHEYEAILVDFHSPRCIHCVKFAPIWEHSAQLVAERSPRRLDKHKRHGVALATLDCVEFTEFCRAQHIMAYPTVRVYRSVAHLAATAASRVDVVQEESGAALKQEVYTGAREAETISAFALKVLQEVLEDDPTLGKDAFLGSDVEGDGTKESEIHVKSCRIEGFVAVRRVPGSLVVRPHSSKGHEFDTSGLVNVDHLLHHLSFGVQFRGSPAASAPIGTMPGSLTTRENLEFKGRVPGSSHVHSIKIISRTRLDSRGGSSQQYEYVLVSDAYVKKDTVPFVTFDYDLSPFQVVVREQRKPWIEGFTAMLAVVGGVWSGFHIIEGVLSYLAGLLLPPSSTIPKYS